MGEVTISVAGRAYQVVCEDGEENRLTAIAARVDREAQAFGGATPSLSEPRLLLMCALLLADKLDEVETAPQTAPVLPPSSVIVEVDTSAIDEATARIEALAQSNSPEAASADTPASPRDETEPATGPAAEASPEPAEQIERRSKSSAAVAAEKDLLSWTDRSEAREDADVADEEADPETEAAENIAPDPSSASEPASESVAEDDGPAEVAAEDEAERTARERSERRKRRRERLARLANETSDDP